MLIRVSGGHLEFARSLWKGRVKMQLTQNQRRFAQHRMAFGTNLLSPELVQALFRAAVACAENQKTETSVVEFICGIYLQCTGEITPYFKGDFTTLVNQNFPIHRFGHEGLAPVVPPNRKASGHESAMTWSASLNYSDELLRLLWLSARLANSVGKAASVKDVVAALALDQSWIDELSQIGIIPSRIAANFDREVRTIVFYTALHTTEGWPREIEFERDGRLLPPFTLEISTPSGQFQPVNSAKVKLNGFEVAGIAWPENPTGTVCVELQNLNKIEFELDGPVFGSVDVTVRGNLAK